MARLIDANEITNWLAKHNKMDEFFVGYLETLVETIPTVDAVEVVRCKDCKYLCFFDDMEIDFWCGVWANKTATDDFCSHGERRTDETD